MRWDGLFADLEAQAEALAVAERAAEIEDRTRSEIGRLSHADRLRAAVGSSVRITCQGGRVMTGMISRTQPEWVLLGEPQGRETLVAMTKVLSIAGLGRLAASAEAQSVVDLRLTLPIVLRRIARDRSNVQVQLVEGAIDGTIDRVGADFFDLALHPPGEARRRAAVLEVSLVPLAAVVAISRNT